MIKSNKKLQELTSVLGKDNNLLISDTIEALRNEQPFEGAIGLLVTYYDKTNDTGTRKTIENFLNDIKDLSAREEVINEIGKQWKPRTISMLVASCWQSGLDYSDYSMEIMMAFLNGDYLTAIECMTVIEEFAHGLNREKKHEMIKIIDQNPVSAQNEKKALTDELMLILTR